MSTPLEEFFAQFAPGFIYRSNRPANQEFYRLCDWNGWEREDPEREEAYQQFQDALVQQFNENYGTDHQNLEAWQGLCARLGIHPIPSTLKQARQKVKSTHVNLVDLTQGYDGSREITIFPTEYALSEYTKDNGLFFPRENANSGNLLKYLLRNIMNPGASRGGHHGRSRRRRGGGSS